MADNYLRSSPHVHTQYCDGKSTAEEIVLAALSRGFVSLGFSGHAWQGFMDESNMTPEREELYLAEVRSLQARYAGKLRIWCGMERDLFSIAQRDRYDYVIGSVHFLRCPDGNMLPVDADAWILREGIGRYFNQDGVGMATAYFRQTGNYIREYKPDIIGHFDLVSKNNRMGDLYDPDHPAVLKASLDALEEAIIGCRLLEVNTGGMARYGAPFPYPGKVLLERWHSLGGSVILSSDCHSADRIDFGYRTAAELIREAGYREAVYLGQDDVLFERCSLH